MDVQYQPCQKQFARYRFELFEGLAMVAINVLKCEAKCEAGPLNLYLKKNGAEFYEIYY